MSDSKQCVVLAARPQGDPVESDFRLESRPLAPLQPGQFLTKNLYISLDAGFRNWMDADSGDNVLPAMPLGEPVMGLTLSQVIQSEHPDYAKDDLIMARFAWETHTVSDGSDFISPLGSVDQPLSYYLGVLGDTGLSAYFGLMDHAELKPGETVLVSAAAGAVGSIAGQIARRFGARTVGISSGAAKCARLRSELGYDAAVDRLAEDVQAEIARACPNGIDVYFDNVGGSLLQPVLDHINVGARVLLCGAVASYNQSQPQPGPNNLFQLTTKQAHMFGFMTHLQESRYDEARAKLAEWIADGSLVVYEHRLQGIEQVGRAFCELFQGVNFGKTIVEL